MYENFLNNKNEDFYYVLGAFITDGSIYFNPKLRAYRSYLYSNDLDWLQDVGKYFCDGYKIYKNRNCNVLTICSKKVTQHFIDNECIPNKSLTAKIPNVPEKYLPDFIRGCIDGDGSLGIYNSTPECYICGSSFNLINGLYLIIKNYYNCNIIRILGKEKEIFGKLTLIQDHYKLRIRGKENLQKFLNYVYYNNHKISLKRKMYIVKEIINLPIIRKKYEQK